MEIDVVLVLQVLAQYIHTHVIQQPLQLQHAQMLEVWVEIDAVRVANYILVMVQLNTAHRVQMELMQVGKYVIAQ